jgi:hypothetical protein
LFLTNSIRQLLYLRESVLHNLFFYNICEVLMHFSCYIDDKTRYMRLLSANYAFILNGVKNRHSTKCGALQVKLSGNSAYKLCYKKRLYFINKEAFCFGTNSSPQKPSAMVAVPNLQHELHLWIYYNYE